MIDLTAEYVRSILHYDPVTGIMTWKVNRPPRGKKGEQAGCVRNTDGRRAIGIKGKMYYAYRLAYLIMTGVWPIDQIDHKSLDPRDDSWANIRAATHGQNKMNHPAHKNSKSGIKGVHYKQNRWKAFIQFNKKTYYLGSFKTSEEAAIAYKAAASRLHQDFARP